MHNETQRVIDRTISTISSTTSVNKFEIDNGYITIDYVIQELKQQLIKEILNSGHFNIQIVDDNQMMIDIKASIRVTDFESNMTIDRMLEMELNKKFNPKKYKLQQLQKFKKLKKLL